MAGWRYGCGALIIAAVAQAVTGPALAQQTAAGIVADAVRDYGHPCADPVSAERDPAASRPDEAAWILTCKDATYRVRFVGSERHSLIVRLR